MERTRKHRDGPMTRRMTRWAAAAAVVMAVVAGGQMGTASADERFVTARLSTSYHRGRIVLLAVTGHVAMSEVDARTFIARPGHEVSLQIWGADSGWCMGEDDDLLVDTYYPALYTAGPTGLTFTRYILVSSSTLNEDDSLFCNNHDDEFYARVRVLDIRTGVVHVAKSNEINGRY